MPPEVNTSPQVARGDEYGLGGFAEKHVLTSGGHWKVASVKRAIHQNNKSPTTRATNLL